MEELDCVTIKTNGIPIGKERPGCRSKRESAVPLSVFSLHRGS